MHLFEGWYDNRAAFEGVRASVGDDRLSCPTCDSVEVDVRPTFRAIINRSPSQPVTAPRPCPASTAVARTDDGDDGSRAPAMPIEVQKALSQLIKHVRAHTEDAGDHFAQRARAMHRGEEPAVPIHGTSTPDERAALLDEGIPCLALPIPDIDQN